MEKIFNSFYELLNFDFTELEPQRSNYLRLIPSDGNLPKVKKEFHYKKWRVVSRRKNYPSRITFETTPRWLTITIHEVSGSKRNDFNLLKKDPKILIQEIFEI